MKTASLMIVAGLAASANAQLLLDSSQYTATATSFTADNLNSDVTISNPVESVGVVYDSMLFEGNVQTPTTGLGGSIVEDYVSIIDSPSTLAVFQFVGGVETANHVVFFNFYDTSAQFVSGFGVRLPSASLTSVWTITITDPTSIAVPAAGFVELVADDGTNNPDLLPTNAAWRFKDVAPAIGSTADEVYRMSLDVIPAPGSAALLALGGFAAMRRRR